MSATAVQTRPIDRVIAVVKLHFTNPRPIIITPWLIMITILVLNIIIWWLILGAITNPADKADAQEGFGYSGSSGYIFVYMIVVAVQAINVFFPFAQGYGVTRRNFSLGTGLTFVILSVAYSAGLTILSIVEDATHGWGVGGSMFSAFYFGDNVGQRFFVFFAIMMFFFFVGSAIAAVYVRWKSTGLITFFALLAFALVGVGALVSLTSSWGSVGAWFAATGLIGSYAWSLAVSALAAICGYLVLRRATPRG